LAGERANGLLSTALGMAMCIGGIGVAANAGLGLWTRSTIESVAYDTARRVAETPSGRDPVAQSHLAVVNARRTLGPVESTVGFHFESTGPDEVALRVTYPGVALLPRFVGGGPIVGAIDRRIVVHRESWP
jgi:hypothetical protein